jgi:quercetin dioxygenase-like cupin family protein
LQIVDTARSNAERITRFRSQGAWSVPVASGSGEAHVYAIHFDPGGEIGPHEAGLDKLFIVVEGSGWWAGEDGARIPLACGQAARFRRGSIHSKGSEVGGKAIMVQMSEFGTEGWG